MSNDSWKWFTPILMITTIVGFSWYLWNSSDDLDFKILKQPQPSQRETSISKPVTPEYPIPQLMDTILDDEDLKILPPLVLRFPVPLLMMVAVSAMVISTWMVL